MTAAAVAPAPEESATREITYAEALNEALREEMRRDPAVFVMGEDVAGWGGGGVFGVTKGLADEFGAERVRDTPISEEAIAAVAVGAAATGSRPVAEIMYVDFIGLAMEPLVNQAAKLRYMFGGKARVPMVLRAQEGAGRGNAAQHSQSLEAWFCHIPGLKVVTPSTPADAKGLLKSAIRDDNPVIFLEHKVLYTVEGDVPEEAYAIPFAEANVLREGDDVTLVAVGRMVHLAEQAAEALAGEGIECEVVDLRTTSPLDEDTILESVENTGRLVVVDEANPRCGLAADIVARVTQEAFGELKAPPRMVTPPHTPVPFSPILEDAYVPTPETIAEAVRSIAGAPAAA